MELSLLTGTGGPWTEYHCCVTSKHIPGRSLPLSDEEHARVHKYGRLVKSVPLDKVLAVDVCWGRVSLTEVDKDCRFIDRKKLGSPSLCRDVTLRMDALLRRKILVIDRGPANRAPKPAGRFGSDWAVVARDLRLTFFYSDGRTLINDTFASPGISPEKMADAGFRFTGSATDDQVACFACASKVRFWKTGDDPELRYREHSGCSGSAVEVFKKRYPDSLPTLRSGLGLERTCSLYGIGMPSMPPESAGNSLCCKAVLVTPPYHRLSELSPLEASRMLNDIDKDDLREAIRQETTTRLSFSNELIVQLKKLIYMEHFKDLMSQFYPLCSEFQGCVSQASLNSICLDRPAALRLQNISAALEEFNTTNLTPCIDVLCQKRIVEICELRMADITSSVIQQVQLSDEQQELEMVMKKITSMLAGRYYIDDLTNSLMEDSTLVHLSFCGESLLNARSRHNEWWQPYHSEIIDHLRISAIQLNRVLVEISKKMHELLLIQV